jgi:predicted O-methyltransferase YrrM
LARVYQAPDWQQYQMEMRDPHRELESPEQEIAIVDQALAVLTEAGILPHARYDHQRFLAHRRAVMKRFEIPWTAITPRMQRLLYAINAILEPATMVAAGIFCGNTFISNAGAAVGPGACYRARRLVGLEIKPEEAARAARNVASVDPEGQAEILAADGVPYLRDLDGTLELLYLDADGAGGRGKSVYLDMVEAAEHALRPGSVVLAHNSVNLAEPLAEYLQYVRRGRPFRESVNLFLDGEGLEASVYDGQEGATR